MAEGTTVAPVVPNTPAPSASAQNKPAATAIAPCDKPGGLGLFRIVEIDTTGGPGFGFEHFKQYDFLRDKEVVSTFDDGPWPGSTPAVLKALANECLKATFFEIGEHATWHPEITKQVIDASMTVGTHTWSHKDLARNPYAKDIEQAEQEIARWASARCTWPQPAVKLRRSSASLTAAAHVISGRAQYRYLLDRHRLARLQDAQA